MIYLETYQFHDNQNSIGAGQIYRIWSEKAMFERSNKWFWFLISWEIGNNPKFETSIEASHSDSDDLSGNLPIPRWPELSRIPSELAKITEFGAKSNNWKLNNEFISNRDSPVTIIQQNSAGQNSSHRVLHLTKFNFFFKINQPTTNPTWYLTNHVQRW